LFYVGIARPLFLFQGIQIAAVISARCCGILHTFVLIVLFSYLPAIQVCNPSFFSYFQHAYMGNDDIVPSVCVDVPPYGQNRLNNSHEFYG
jgi:hypothetical protein